MTGAGSRSSTTGSPHSERWTRSTRSSGLRAPSRRRTCAAFSSASERALRCRRRRQRPGRDRRPAADQPGADRRAGGGLRSVPASCRKLKSFVLPAGATPRGSTSRAPAGRRARRSSTRVRARRDQPAHRLPEPAFRPALHLAAPQRIRYRNALRKPGARASVPRVVRRGLPRLGGGPRAPGTASSPSRFCSSRVTPPRAEHRDQCRVSGSGSYRHAREGRVDAGSWRG